MLLDNLKPYLCIPRVWKPECQDGNREYPVGGKKLSECQGMLMSRKPGSPAAQAFRWWLYHVLANGEGTLSRAQGGLQTPNHTTRTSLLLLLYVLG